MSFTGDLATAAGVPNAFDAADALCAQAVASAGLGGVWRAYISADVFNARLRHRNAEFRLMGTTTNVFRTLSRFGAAPEVAIDRNEFGAIVPPSRVWTGTGQSGTNSGELCNEWNTADISVRGSAGSTTDRLQWADEGNLTCDSLARLYCLEL